MTLGERGSAEARKRVGCRSGEERQEAEQVRAGQGREQNRPGPPGQTATQRRVEWSGEEWRVAWSWARSRGSPVR